MSRPEISLKPNILISPLDWGLGHATRCIPIINRLIKKNCRVLIACEGKIRLLLEKEFPQLPFIDLKGYRISYSKNSRLLPLQIGKQIPKILSTIQYENERVKAIVKDHTIHGIISDNRFGFYHDAIPSVFITHQLFIKTNLGKFSDHYLQKLNYKYINHFTECWVPDNESSTNLGGKLSHPETKPSIPTKYIGPVSRFEKLDVEEKYLLVLLSGPEPQRTLLENSLLTELKNFSIPVVLVRGLPDESKELQVPSNIAVYNHLPAEQLNQKMNEALVVISRCGYSTVMDLAVLKKKSILIPTPGQTEQEYLAGHLMKNNFALCIEQKKFRLSSALELSNSFDYRFHNYASALTLEDVLQNFIGRIQTDIGFTSPSLKGNL
jgi:uncharacterized protein (TIGR00661 family)